ncbi:DUF58 domain-containing protein [Nannocystaceae bacterium ST9]
MVQASDDPIETLIPASLRAALARRELLVRRPVAGVRHGQHRSLRPGLGRDFRDYRAYVPGDDPRRLDWRAAARSQRLVVRQTESEEELALVLAIDGSGGMDYGEGAGDRWRWAGTLAASLATLALRQGDRVGFALGRAGAIETGMLEPTARRDRLRALGRLFVHERPRGTCPWPELLGAIAARLRRQSLIVVLSDLLDPAGNPDSTDRSADEALLRDLGLLRAGGHDVVVVQLLHPDELEFPWAEPRVLQLEDPRGRRPEIEGPGSALREGYLGRLDEHLRWLEHACEQVGLLHARVVTQGDPTGPLLELLARLAGVPVEPATREAER